MPVENKDGGSGVQDSHWRKSVMGSEVMTPTIGSSGAFSKITIQSMADLGYTVDDGVAEGYTVANIAGQVPPAIDSVDHSLSRNCVVDHPAHFEFVSGSRARRLSLPLLSKFG